MKVLIDNQLCEIDMQGYKIGKDITGRTCRVAYHGTALLRWLNSKENFKLITCGHVYIINYNAETFNGKKPLTFDEYLESKL